MVLVSSGVIACWAAFSSFYPLNVSLLDLQIDCYSRRLCGAEW